MIVHILYKWLLGMAVLIALVTAAFGIVFLLTYSVASTAAVAVTLLIFAAAYCIGHLVYEFIEDNFTNWPR